MGTNYYHYILFFFPCAQWRLHLYCSLSMLLYFLKQFKTTRWDIFFPLLVVSDFQFRDNICYLTLQRPYLNLQNHIVIQFTWITLFSSFFFFFNQPGYSSNCSFFTIIFSLLSKFLHHLTHNMTEEFTLARLHGFTGPSVLSYTRNSAQHWLDSLITWQTSFSLIMTLILSSHSNKLIAAICLLKYFEQKIIFCSWHNCPSNSVMYTHFICL